LTAQEAANRPARTLFRRIGNWSWRDCIVYLGFGVVFVFFAIAIGSDFLNIDNLENIIRVSTPISVMAVGMTFVLSAGEIDLSIGATVALSALVTALILENTNPVLAVLGGLGVGIGVGLVNGVITVKFRVPSFLVTLGTLSVLTGLARMTTNLESVPVLNNRFTAVFGSGSVGPVSSLVIWTLIVLAVGHVVYRHTPYGRRVLATGGNRKAAEAVGVSTARIKISVLVLSGLTAALAGILYAGWLQGARYSLGDQDMLTVISAVVVGGTSLFGGKGSIMGSIVGSLLMGMLSNGLILMGLDVSGQMVARGGIIIIAVALTLREARY
jgi:ribose transport system permease protein